MAELRRVTKRSVESNFRRVAPQAGFAFQALGQMAQEAYDFLEPAAIADQQRKGAEAGREMARLQEGRNRVQRPDQQPDAPDGGLSRVGEQPARGVTTPQVTTGPIDDDIAAFNAGLARTESGGDLNVVNSEGFTGRYQFGQGRLDDFNRANGTSYQTSDLRGNEGLTEQVQNWHVGDIDTFIESNGLASYEGQQVGGVTVTRNGMRAMAHLGGKGGMQRFLTSGGSYNPADSNGTSLADYAATHANPNPTITAGADGTLSGGGFDTVDVSSVIGDQAPETQVSTRSAPPVSEPETTIRTADGKIEPRLFSPSSGPIRQAYNAAAGVAYVSEKTVQGLADIMTLSTDHRGSPEAFQDATRDYIDQAITDAPEEFQEDLRASLTTESQRRYLGMLDEQSKDADQRANNSSKALAERYSSDYAEALASGRSEDAAVARQQLESVLYARESLPGIAWTREQSENLLMGAMDSAEQMRQSQAKAMSDEWKDQFDTIIHAANDGRTSEFDTLLGNEAAISAHPELAREAAAMVTVRDNMPGFMSATPSQQAEVLAAERARPIGAEWETDVLDAMTKAHNSTVKALEDDPIQYGMDNLPGSPPPLDPELAMSDPGGFLNAMKARAEFGNQMQGEGWIDFPAFLTNEEVAAFSGLLGKDTPPEIRAALAGTIVNGFGADAVNVFNELDADPVTMFGGQLMSAGGMGQQATFMQALQGQALLDANQVQLPSGASRLSSFSPEAATAMQGIPGASGAQEQVMKFAQALYASSAQGIDPASEDAKKLMEQATQRALGQQTMRNGSVTGGVQDLYGSPVLMPIGVSSERFDEIVQSTFTAGETQTLGEGIVAGMMMSDTLPNVDIDATKWQEASPRGMVPMWGDQPMDARLFRDERVRVVSAGGDMYRMEVTLGQNVTDITTADGSVYVFDMRKFME